MLDKLIKNLTILDALLKAAGDKPRQETLEEFLARGGKKQTAAPGVSGATQDATPPPKKEQTNEEATDAADAFLRSAQQKQETPLDPDAELRQEVAKKYDNWKPIGAKNATEKAKFDMYKQRGFSDREAEQLSGIDNSHLNSHNTARKSRVHPSQPSQAMLELLKPWAEDQVKKYQSMERREAVPEKQPILHTLGKREEAYQDHFNDYKSALQNHRSSDAYKALKPSEKLKSEHEFKKQWTAQNADKLQAMHNKIGQAEATRGEALKTREQELAGIRGEIGMGGASMDTQPVSGEYSSGGSDKSIAESLTGRKQQDDEASSGISISKNPLAQFAQQYPAYAKHLSEKHKDRLNHINAAKQRQIMEAPVDESADVEPEQPVAARQPGQIDPEEQHRLKRIKELATQKSKWTPEQQLAANHFVKDWLPAIQKHAFSLYGSRRIGRDDVEDMFSHGIHGLLQAVGTYDPVEAANKSTGEDTDRLFHKHAEPKIRGAMLTQAAKNELIPQHERVAAKKFEAKARATPAVETPAAPETPKKPGE